jgi:dephospho-CoA kinase
MGAGKSTAAAFLSRNTATVIDADGVAKDLMTTSTAVRRELKRVFGNGVFVQTRLHFGALGAAAFESPAALRRLNAIVHPPLVRRLRRMVFGESQRGVVLDAALIPLWHIEEWFDRLVWIAAPATLRLQRLRRKADGLTDTALRRRMRLQQGLFAPPSDARWHVVENRRTIRALQRSLRAVVARPR